MTDIEYLFIGLGVGIGMRLLIAVLDALASMFNKDRRDNEL